LKDKEFLMSSIARGAGTAALSLVLGLAWTSAPAMGATRYEETDPAVSLGAGWSEDTSRPWSAGAAAVSAAPGAQATFTFTGTSVNWIGGLRPDTGIATVYVDGAAVAQVDTYSKTEETRVAVFTASGLANTTHALTIQVTGQKNANAASPMIVVDAFDVPGPAVSRLQETDPSVALTTGWVQDNPVVTAAPGITTGRTQGTSMRAWSAGAAILSVTPGAQATLTFSGTSATWIGARGNQCGIARVYLDGAYVGDFDTYAPAEQIQAAIYTAGGLADTTHTLTVEATGLNNPASQSAIVVIDAFEVTSTGARIQETNPSISYGATGWIMGNRDKAYSEATTAETSSAGARASVSFVGTGISWIGARGPETGIASVFLDGTYVADFDMYSPGEGPQHPVYTARGLAAGTHTLTIEATGMRNTASQGTWILIDAFDVWP
jgi:hypothetical protein